MAYRLTNTDKWKDAWFIELDNDQKLLHDYLQDNVDNAGFLEISFRKLKFDLRFSDDEILGAIKGLTRGLIFFKEGLENGDTIYFKNFLKHQKNYPLNPFNSFHNHALKIFEERIDLIEKSPVLSNFEVSGVSKKTKEKINTNLLEYLKTKQGLASPLVKVIVKGEVEVIEKGTFEKSEKLLQMEVDSETEILSAYQFLKKHDSQKMEAFEMQNKKSFKNYEAFVINFNSKCIEEEIEFDSKKLFARLERLNANWHKEEIKPMNYAVTEKMKKYD